MALGKPHLRRSLGARVSSHAQYLLLLGSLVLPATAYGRTWIVQVDGLGNAPTVQAGIDSAAAGDTVLVHPGTYPEAIDFRGKDILVRSSAGPNVTTLDATGLGVAVVVFGSGESRLATLRGFRVTGGTRGILIFSAQPSVLDNEITGNGVAQNGGGIWCTADTFIPWRPLIEGNLVANNRAGNLAGGIGTLQRMIPDILDNRVEGNEARDGDGGGIYYRSFENGALIRGNTVINNKAGDHGGGIYAALVGSPPSPPPLELEISWNLIAGNTAAGSDVTGDSGGGMTLIETNAWVHHNTIAANEGGAGPTRIGGGLVIERIGSPVIEKNIIALNTQGGGVFCFKGATPTLRNNLAWQNVGGDGVGECPTWWQINGNLVTNPYFCDPGSGEYSLAQNSPALTHLAGPLGCFPIPGCGPVATFPTTWGSLKARYPRAPR